MCTSAPCVPTALGVPWGYSTTIVRVVGPRTEIGVTFLYPTPMGRALLARPPKRVWGVTRNVTDNSPTSIGTLCVAPWCPKHTGVSVVASVFAKSVTFRGTLLGLFCCFGAVWGASSRRRAGLTIVSVPYPHLRAHGPREDLVCRLWLEKKHH